MSRKRGWVWDRVRLLLGRCHSELVGATGFTGMTTANERIAGDLMGDLGTQEQCLSEGSEQIRQEAGGTEKGKRKKKRDTRLNELLRHVSCTEANLRLSRGNTPRIFSQPLHVGLCSRLPHRTAPSGSSPLLFGIMSIAPKMTSQSIIPHPSMLQKEEDTPNRSSSSATWSHGARRISKRRILGRDLMADFVPIWHVI